MGDAPGRTFSIPSYQQAALLTSLIGKPLPVPRHLLAQAAMRLLPDVFEGPSSSGKPLGRPGQHTDRANTAWPGVLTVLGPPGLTAKPPHLPGPSLLREPNPPARWYLPSQAQAGGPPWGWVLRVACGACAWGPGAPRCQHGREPAPEGGGGEHPLGPALKAGSPQAPAGSLGATSPTEGGPEAPGLPDKELVGLVAPGGTQQGPAVHASRAAEFITTRESAEQRPSPGNRPQFIRYLDLLKY